MAPALPKFPDDPATTPGFQLERSERGWRWVAFDLLGHDRHAVAVIGDGALPSGIVFEALNNVGGMGQNLMVVLNDNKMSICPRTGGLAKYLDSCRMTGFYQGSKRRINQILSAIPVIGSMAQSALEQFRDGLKGVARKSFPVYRP